MRGRSAARRLPALACVALAHLILVAIFLTVTQPPEVPVAPDRESLLVLLLPGAADKPAGLGAPAQRVRIPAAAVNPMRPPQQMTPPAQSPVTPDWSVDAGTASGQEAAAIELGRRQSGALAPPPSALRAPQPPHAMPFHWERARTQRIEPLPTGGTLVHLNERCALVLFFIIPMAGCALGTVPARDDLFDHMRDAPALGNWKD